MARPSRGCAALRRPRPSAAAARVCLEMEREEMRFVQTLEKGEALLEESLRAALASGTKARPPPLCLSA